MKHFMRGAFSALALAMMLLPMVAEAKCDNMGGWCWQWQTMSDDETMTMEPRGECHGTGKTCFGREGGTGKDVEIGTKGDGVMYLLPGVSDHVTASWSPPSRGLYRIHGSLDADAPVPGLPMMIRLGRHELSSLQVGESFKFHRCVEAGQSVDFVARPDGGVPLKLKARVERLGDCAS